MAIPVFPPTREADLLAWSSNWSTRITATPLDFGLSAPLASAYAALHATWAAKYADSINPNTNTKAAMIAKNQAKEALLDGPGGARELVAIVQAFPGTTNEMRGELGLRIRDTEPSPRPIPTDAPELTVVGVAGRKVTLRLRDPKNPDRRGKPDGVQGITVLTHVGATAPQDPMEWVFTQNTSRTTFDVDFPSTIPAGTTVWLTAFWFNARKETSPPAIPMSTVLQHAVAMPLVA